MRLPCRPRLRSWRAKFWRFRWAGAWRMWCKRPPSLCPAAGGARECGEPLACTGPGGQKKPACLLGTLLAKISKHRWRQLSQRPHPQNKNTHDKWSRRSYPIGSPKNTSKELLGSFRVSMSLCTTSASSVSVLLRRISPYWASDFCWFRWTSAKRPRVKNQTKQRKIKSESTRASLSPGTGGHFYFFMQETGRRVPCENTKAVNFPRGLRFSSFEIKYFFFISSSVSRKVSPYTHTIDSMAKKDDNEDFFIILVLFGFVFIVIFVGCCLLLFRGKTDGQNCVRASVRLKRPLTCKLKIPAELVSARLHPAALSLAASREVPDRQY